MKFFFTSVIAFFLSISMHAQLHNSQQEKIALQFTSLFIQKEFAQCWPLFDTEMNPQFDSIAFCRSLEELSPSLPSDSREIELHMSGHKFVQGRETIYYSYKYSHDVSKPAGFLIDVLFSNDSSLYIAGFQPKSTKTNPLHASSSEGEEIIISEIETITVDYKEYVSRGVNIIQFTENESLIAIQIEQELQGNMDKEQMKLWAETEAVKFAKWLYTSDYYKYAVKKASELQRELLPKLGVSFINPKTGIGYNVMVEEKMYK